MNLNNKGFAITGILYTLFILFLLILVAILSGLSLSKNLLNESTESLEESLSGTLVPLELIGDPTTSGWSAPFSGKYIFKVNNLPPELEELTCTTYLNKNDSFNDVTFIPDDCNEYYDLKLTLDKAYKFEDRS